MAKFKTKEIDSEGRVVVGEYTLEDVEAVRFAVSEKGNKLLKVDEVAEKKDIEINLFAPKPKPKALALFCKQLHTMLFAGMPLVTALDVLADQATDKKFKAVIQDMSLRVQRGSSLTDAMNAQGRYFPELLRGMVAAGELTGNLDDVMERMSVHFTKENKINSKIRGAMMYPIILSVISIGAVVFLLVKVIPNFVQIFKDFDSELPGITQFVINLSDSIALNWYIYLGVLIGIVVGFTAFYRTKQGRILIDGMKLKLPGIKKPMAQIVSSRFTRTLSTLLKSGIALLVCLETAGEVSGNAYVKLKLEEVADGIKKGIQLAPLLEKTEIFPRMMVSMVGIGEESGALEELLEKTADYYDSELDDAISQLMAMMEPLLILFVGGMIGVIIIAMLLPMVSLFSAVQI